MVLTFSNTIAMLCKRYVIVLNINIFKAEMYLRGVFFKAVMLFAAQIFFKK